MVNDLVQENSRPTDDMQDLGVQRVQGPANGSVHDESGGRRLSLRAVLLHDAHLQDGRRTAERCGICSEGLEGALEKVTERSPRRGESEVVPSSGGDQEGSATPPPDDRASGKENQVLWR